ALNSDKTNEERSDTTEYGLKVQQLTPQLATHFQVEEEGVLVSEVLPHTAADRAGIKRGDIILEVNHRKLTGVKDFKELLNRSEVEEISLTILRNRETFLVALRRLQEVPR
ncbi:MAG: PDZ domain-containing protein, partial [Candidatus Tectomicrobia bacterium]|nr:PDZ domain-containing protein [Candidatus Tectomicrobia bacterium]